MSLWSRLDTDEERLPDGMLRIGYDADTQVYTYRDEDGSIWEGAPGARYGTLRRRANSKSPPPTAETGSSIRETASPPPLPDDAFEFLMLADAHRKEKRPRSRYRPRPGSEAASRKSTLGGLLQL